jgi:hypothetical protein
LNEQIAAWNAKVIPEAEVFRRTWSWAAFLSPVLWPLTHGWVLLSVTEMTILVTLRFARLGQVSILLWFLILATRVALGIVGNRLALSGRRFESTVDFVDCETAWRNFGVFCLAVTIAILVLRFGFLLTSRHLV